jgi:hypothetical protein
MAMILSWEDTSLPPRKTGNSSGGVEEYRSLSAGRDVLGSRLERFLAEFPGLDQTDDPFAGIRRKDPVREVELRKPSKAHAKVHHAG